MRGGGNREERAFNGFSAKALKIEGGKEPLFTVFAFRPSAERKLNVSICYTRSLAADRLSCGSRDGSLNYRHPSVVQVYLTACDWLE